jgi:hypothetical protein
MRFSMAVMRMTRELGRDLDLAWQSCGAHGCSIGVRPALLGSLHYRVFPPRVTGVQLVPLWNIAGPHTGKLKPGPSRGPVFYCVIVARERLRN